MSHPALHPFNEGFLWRSSPVGGRALSEEQASRFDDEGFLLCEGVFDADQIARAVQEIDPFEEKVEDFLRTRDEGRLFIAKADAITFTTHLVARSRYLRELSAAPAILGLCHDLIGPDVRLYWDQAVYKKPEKPRSFPWHQDNGYTYLEPQQYLTCWVALSDATVDNGCPWVVPGLHRRGTLAHRLTDAGWQCLEEPENAVAVPARAGSVVVFSSLTPHSTGPNLTDAVRKSYIVQFAPDGARVLEAQPGEPEPVVELQDDRERQFPVLVAGRPPV